MRAAPNPFANGTPDGIWQRDCSEQTAREIDQEVKKILDRAYAEAKTILAQHRPELDLLAGELLEHETLDEKAFTTAAPAGPASNPRRRHTRPIELEITKNKTKEKNMAIQLTEKHGGKVLEVRVSGKLAHEDYQHFVPEFERLV